MEPIADTWLIIADGSTEVAEARQKLANLEQRVFPVGLPSGYPQLLDSSDLPGLKPGYSIVVLGACGSRADADARLDLVRAVAPGAYLRRVVGREACPIVATTTPVTSSGPMLASWPVGGESKAHFDFRRPTSSPDCPNQSLVLEARLENERLVSTLALTGECTSSGEFELGRKSTWTDPVPVTVDGQTFFALRVTDSAAGNDVSTDYLYGFVCGQWRPVLGPLVGGSGPDAVVNRFDSPGLGKIRVRRWTGNPSDTDLGGPPNETLNFTLDPRTCTTLPAQTVTLESLE